MGSKRTFALTYREAMASNAVVEGMISISGYIAHALFDPEATHSFISSAFAYKLNQVSEPLGFQLVVSTPIRVKMGFQLVVSTPIRVKIIASTKSVNYEVMIGEMETSIDLFKLGEMEFDAILGMDWLSACDTHVDCNRKRIIFKMEGVSEFIFEGVKVSHEIPYISAIKATKLMRQGCQEFLASVLDTTRIDIKIETIPVVNEFPDVFPEDLSGLPQDRDAEFAIAVMPGTAPILKAPYRMAPVEMKELKTQL